MDTWVVENCCFCFFPGSRANGYQALPDFPEVAPDPTVRVVEVASPIARASMGIVKTVTGRNTVFDGLNMRLTREPFYIAV